MALILPPPPNATPATGWSSEYINWAEKAYQAVQYKGVLCTLDQDYTLGAGFASDTSNSAILGWDVVTDTENTIEDANTGSSYWTNGKVFRMPEGVFRCRIDMQLRVDPNGHVASPSGRNFLLVNILKSFPFGGGDFFSLNNNPGIPNYIIHNIGQITAEHDLRLNGVVVEAEPGDAIRVDVFQLNSSSGNSIVRSGNRSWLSIEWIR